MMVSAWTKEDWLERVRKASGEIFTLEWFDGPLTQLIDEGKVICTYVGGSQMNKYRLEVR